MASLKAFEDFNWAASEAWQKHYAGVYPIPNHIQLLKIKQKWFKSNVDPNFDPNPTSSQNSGSGNGPRTFASGNRSSNAPRAISTLQILQTVLFLLAFPGFFINKSLHLIVAGHFAGIIHYHNIPRLNADYWKNVILDDNFHAICFALIFLFFNYQVL